MLPGLVQTREYAEAVMRTHEPDATDQQIRHWLDFRFATAFERYERHALDAEDSRVYIKSRMEQLA